MQRETLQALTGISFAYTSFNNYREAIKYKIKQWKTYEILINDTKYREENTDKLNSDSLKISQSIATLAFYYTKLNQLDSAFYYGREALIFANSIQQKDASYMAYPLNCIGITYRLSGNLDSAMYYYRQSVAQSELSTNKKNRITNLYKSYWEMAIVYQAQNNIDSSIYYGELALSNCSQLKWDKDALEIQILLAKNYSGLNDRLAVKYYEDSFSLRDSLYNHEKMEQIKNITFNEKERQEEIAEQRRLQEEERKKRIQTSLIGLAILAIILLFIALSRNLVTSDKINTYFATLALLMIFEFFNLTVGPYISLFTANISYLSFVTSICMALLLSPVQQLVKKWLTKKMKITA